MRKLSTLAAVVGLLVLGVVVIETGCFTPDSPRENSAKIAPLANADDPGAVVAYLVGEPVEPAHLTIPPAIPAGLVAKPAGRERSPLVPGCYLTRPYSMIVIVPESVDPGIMAPSSERGRFDELSAGTNPPLEFKKLPPPGGLRRWGN